MNIVSSNHCIKNVLWDFKNDQEIGSAGGRTVWGNPAEVGSVVGGEAFDVVLDNNGKDLEAVRSVSLILLVFNALPCLPCLVNSQRLMTSGNTYNLSWEWILSCQLFS